MSAERKFIVLPPVSRAAGEATTARRPMTSKQVRQAYKASTRTPTLSRTEQRRLERAEQDRIRRELEREKAAARAQAARERRRRRELAEREARKRMQLPPVAVRPSQDTLSRFVRVAAGDAHGVPTGDRRRGLDVGSKHPPTAPHMEDKFTQEASTQQRQDLAASSTKTQSPVSTPGKTDAPTRAMATTSDPPRLPLPPPSTQAILVNWDLYFPSSSQQERELRDEPIGESSPTTPNERRRRPLSRLQANCAVEPRPPDPRLKDDPGGGRPEGKLPTQQRVPDKENAGVSNDDHNRHLVLSQESDYGGQWVEEMAADLAI